MTDLVGQRPKKKSRKSQTLSESEFLGLTCASNSTSESGERNASLVIKNVLKIFLSFLDSHSLNGSNNLEGVLEVSTKVISSSFTTLFSNSGLLRIVVNHLWNFNFFYSKDIHSKLYFYVHTQIFSFHYISIFFSFET